MGYMKHSSYQYQFNILCYCYTIEFIHINIQYQEIDNSKALLEVKDYLLISALET